MQVALSRIRNPHRKVRSSGLQELIAEIKLNGMVTPIVVVRVQNNRFKIIDGLRRFTAARRLGWKSLPVHVISY